MSYLHFPPLNLSALEWVLVIFVVLLVIALVYYGDEFLVLEDQRQDTEPDNNKVHNGTDRRKEK